MSFRCSVETFVRIEFQFADGSTVTYHEPIRFAPILASGWHPCFQTVESNADTESVSCYLAKIGKKGGERKVPKGLACLPIEKRKAIAAKGLAARRKNARRKP